MKLLLLFLMTFAATVLAEKPARDIQRPVPVEKTEPLYTEQARLAGVEGTVLVSAQLDEKGRLSDMKSSKGSVMVSTRTPSTVCGSGNSGPRCATESRSRPKSSLG
jgi:hypothetical protein